MSHCRLVGQILQSVVPMVCVLIGQWTALPSTVHATWAILENVVSKQSQPVLMINLLAYIKGIST